METRQIKAEGKLDFDIIIDGKYLKRVSRGVLLEIDGGEATAYLSGDKKNIFAALLGLTMFVTQNGLKEEFDKFVVEALN